MTRRTATDGWIAVALFAAVMVAYYPALRAGFVWDDDAHLTAPALRSPSGLWRIWTEVGATQQYYPILHSWFWAEHRLWGNAPSAYHLANIFLHGASACLLGLVLRRLALRGVVLAAFVFALHPVHVESVAWISEQKNTFSTLFYLAAALVYLRFDTRREPWAYGVALGLYLVALLTKTVTATLPASLLVVFWWQRGHLSWRRDVWPLVPWLMLGAGAGLFTAWVERRVIGAEGTAFDLGFLDRCLLAGRVTWFYVEKLLWPANLTFNYPRWDIGATSIADWLALAALVASLVTVWRFRTRSRAPLATVLLFGGTLFPVLGFFNVYPFQYSFVADHFLYLASLPAITGVVGLVVYIRPAVSELWRPSWSAALLLLGALAVMTWQQALLYRDNRTLFSATIARNPESWMARNNLAKELMTAPASLPEAIAQLERAIALRPEYPEALNNLGLALTQSGRSREAIPHLEASLRLKPNSFQTHNNLGIALASCGRAEEALAVFAQAATLNPTLPNIHENWAKALIILGRKEEADQRFAIAARLRETAGQQRK